MGTLQESFELLLRQSPQLHDVESSAVLGLVQAKGITYHDASYLWLARQLRVERISLDARLNAAIEAR